MALRLQLAFLLTLGLIILAGLLAIAPTRAAGELVEIACPNKQTTFLEGAGAPPNESLIAYLSARPVGGGSSRPDGSWRIPLQVNERPGVYPVEVKVRGTRALVASFTCYVDVPVATSEAPLPTDAGGVTEVPTLTRTTAPVGTAVGQPTRTATTTATRSGTAPTTGATSARATSGTTTATTTSATAALTRTATRTATTTITTTTTSQSAEVRISDVYCRDPAFPEDSEYIELRNDDTEEVNLAGWRVINTSRSNVSYVFPSYAMEGGPDVYVTLWSGIGTNRPDFAEFYWNRTDQLWFVGDRAELRDASGNLIDAYTVTEDNCTS